MAPFSNPSDAQPDLSELQERALRRRQRYARAGKLARPLLTFAVVCTSRLWTWVSTWNPAPRTLLHLFIVVLVVLTGIVSRLPADMLMTNRANPGSTGNFLSDLVAPVFPASSEYEYTGDTPVPDEAFAAIDALPVIESQPRLHGPFTTMANTVVDSASIRTGPGTEYDQLGTLSMGTSVQVVARHGDWFQVRGRGGEIFWVAAELLNVNATAREILPEATNIPTPPPPRVGTVNTSNLALRDGPGTTYVGLTRLSNGTSLELLASYGDWLQVQTAQGTVGWVSGEYLDIADGVIERVEVVNSVPEPDPALVGAINAQSVNLRGGPGTDYNRIGRLTADTTLDLLGRHGDWLQVRTPQGTVGWVSSELISASNYVVRRVPQAQDIPALPQPEPQVVAQSDNFDQPAAPEQPASEPAQREPEPAQPEPEPEPIRPAADPTQPPEERFEPPAEPTQPPPSPTPPPAERFEPEPTSTRPAPSPTQAPPEPTSTRPAPSPTQPAPEPSPTQPAPSPTQPAPDPTEPAPEPEPTEPAPEPSPTQPAPEPSPTQPAPEPTQPAPEPEPTQPDLEPEPLPTEPAPEPPPPSPTPEPPPPTPEPTPEPVVPASQVVDFAMQFVGVNYVWGGASPSGFDCSGFTMYVYGNFGLSLPHNAAAQYNTRYGAIISSQAELLPGDLVFFANTYTAGISHVGIYIGGGNVVQALSPGQGVGVASLYSSYWAQHYYSALRPNL
jgi:cell wall-associated NlpC family hydrolase